MKGSGKLTKCVVNANDSTKSNQSKCKTEDTVVKKRPLKAVKSLAKKGNASTKLTVSSKSVYSQGSLSKSNKNCTEKRIWRPLPAPDNVKKTTIVTAANKRYNKINSKPTDNVVENRPIRGIKSCAETREVNPKSTLTSKSVLCKKSPTTALPNVSIAKNLRNTTRNLVKFWRPPPSHSGVPVPEKMKKLLLKLKNLRKSSITTTDNTIISESKNMPADNEEEQQHLKDVKSPAKTKMVKRKSIGSSTKVLCKRSPKISLPKLGISNNVIKTARKAKRIWRPLPAHSGVPVPEKMKKLSLKLLDLAFYANEYFNV